MKGKNWHPLTWILMGSMSFAALNGLVAFAAAGDWVQAAICCIATISSFLVWTTLLDRIFSGSHASSFVSFAGHLLVGMILTSTHFATAMARIP